MLGATHDEERRQQRQRGKRDGPANHREPGWPDLTYKDVGAVISARAALRAPASLEILPSSIHCTRLPRAEAASSQQGSLHPIDGWARRNDAERCTGAMRVAGVGRGGGVPDAVPPQRPKGASVKVGVNAAMLLHAPPCKDRSWPIVFRRSAVVVHRFEPPQCLLLAPMGHAHDAEASATEPIYVGWGGAARHGMSWRCRPRSQRHWVSGRLFVRVHLTELPTATALWVQADSNSDWDTCSSMRALACGGAPAGARRRVGQRLPLWVNQSGCVWLRVQRAEPEAPAIRMAAGMDLIVAPPRCCAGKHGGRERAVVDGPRAKARRLRIGRVEDAGVADEMTIGLSKQAMLTLGAHEGQIVHLWTGHRAALAPPPNDPRQRRGCAPGYCFGFASSCRYASPLLPMRCSRALRHMLGCERLGDQRAPNSAAGRCARPADQLLLRRKHVARLVLSLSITRRVCQRRRPSRRSTLISSPQPARA